MIVAFDNTFLSLVFNPKTQPRPDPSTGNPVSHCRLRIEALIDELSARGDSIIIPTPCLCEMLTAVPDSYKAIEYLDDSAAFRTESFDTKCAIGLADITRKAINAGDKKSGSTLGWQEIKFDRQIAMIAHINRARILYTDDEGQSKFAEEVGLEVKHTWNLDLPASHAQTKMDLQ